jgi:uncharacterized protein
MALTLSRVRAPEAVAEVLPAQHSLIRSALLHLLPGVAILAAYVGVQPLAARLGLPALFALLAAVLLVGMPIQVGHLLILGRRRNGRWSLDGVVSMRAALRARQYAVLVPVLLVWSFLCYGLLSPVSDILSRTVFGWLPQWFFRDDLSHVSRPVLLATVTLLLVLNGVAAPVVEELYFRGYLLPRLGRLGAWAPVVNLVLFTLYHLWQPWLYPTLLVALGPLIFAVWRTRSVRLGMITHCALNLIGGLASVGLLLGAH